MTEAAQAFSISEEHGISAIPEAVTQVYSVGISTGGIAEMRMAAGNLARHIVATTIDVEGADYAATLIHERGYDRQIEVRVEDVTRPLPYDEATFEYVYARLVLHYLSKQQLPGALQELHRILAPEGRMFVVVRSTACPDASGDHTSYDASTGLTTTRYRNSDGSSRTAARFFHTEESIGGYVTRAGFTVEYMDRYEERLYKDFMRTEVADHLDDVIELIAIRQ